ncbi:hypothetical protein SAMN04488082_1213 [Desulfomicrobium apsheronum]|uniref:Uncharacterized protein n=1 Tax=Desulfomicrobium apsheronum TaxID=52560 RepID=A0A1I3YS57_9BACT|nr:hypothetical protein SAMN04488082_1213 [Desulfomicrobium apsheronum]
MFLPVSLPVRELSSQSNIGYDGKRLRVTKRCFRAAMLGPASAGVGVRVPRLFGHGPISSLNGGQLDQEPQDYAVDGLLKTVLEFDVGKILLHVKDWLEKRQDLATTPSYCPRPSSTCSIKTWNSSLQHSASSMSRCSETLRPKIFRRATSPRSKRTSHDENSNNFSVQGYCLAGGAVGNVTFSIMFLMFIFFIYLCTHFDFIVQFKISAIF